ncbi:hypothetical protein BVI1335_350050 [Burkholderia vietnamiensis]|nr:hypothetical protein BVI1335_350050 [Burkholderia vietnamiensis]
MSKVFLTLAGFATDFLEPFSNGDGNGVALFGGRDGCFHVRENAASTQQLPSHKPYIFCYVNRTTSSRANTHNHPGIQKNVDTYYPEDHYSRRDSTREMARAAFDWSRA